MKKQPPSSHLPLTVPVFQILVSLGDSELHGYAIIKDIRERTEGPWIAKTSPWLV